ncbi:MAG: hypothetical protein KDC18_02920 [Alphaproteobacteria bacterium]|nr:hypothetical protein [Alphaproteobacteria bacterium]MCB9931734.1 hypothetical protein [Alphaproteobacteria bacterium]
MTDAPALTVSVPFRVSERGGRKVMVPSGGRAEPAPAQRWKRLLKDGHYASLTELARAEGINRPCLCRVFRLTLPAPDLVAAILAGRQPEGLPLKSAMRPMPPVWDEPADALGGAQFSDEESI